MNKIIPTHWFYGIRLYIAVAIGLITIETIWWAKAVYPSSNLAAIRMEEIFAWLAVGFLAAAMLIGPLCKVFPAIKGRNILRDARRLLGVGAAWFAALHVVIAYSTLFNFANVFTLTKTYQWAFLVGSLALLILLAMAATSFNGAMRRLGRNWFRLHRLVYAAALLTILHALIIGVHARRALPLTIIGLLCAVVLGLHIRVRLMVRKQVGSI